MTRTGVAIQRLHNQHLIEGLDNPVEVVRSLGAVQSQDFIGARWAVGQRCTSTTEHEVTRLFNEGKILRTHLLRPTWHFVLPEDIRWIQELTALRVHAFNKHYYARFGLDQTALSKGLDTLGKVLEGGQQLTRREVKETFHKEGIEADGLRFSYLIMYAELEGLVCSGALKGRQHTLALLADRAPQAKSLPFDEALAELAIRFFASHGPATAQDLMWWSSLTSTDVKKGIESAGLQRIEDENKVYYSTGDSDENIPSSIVHLLPNFDEYVIAYKDRRALMAIELDKAPSYQDLSSHFILLNGQLIGGWKRGISAKSFEIQQNLFTKLNLEEREALEAAADRLEKYLNLPVKLL